MIIDTVVFNDEKQHVPRLISLDIVPLLIDHKPLFPSTLLPIILFICHDRDCRVSFGGSRVHHRRSRSILGDIPLGAISFF